MSTSPLLVMDTKSDRRDIWHLLHRLPPKARVRFVGAMCKRVVKLTGDYPHPRYDRELLDLAYRDDSADERVTNATYGDLICLGSQWRLDMTAAAVELERWVRLKESGQPLPRPAPPAGPSPSRPS